MARRHGTWLLGSAALSLGALSSFSGCYQHHTADEDALTIDFPAGSYDAGATADSGSSAGDGSAATPDAGNCGAPGTIQSFLCGLTGGGGMQTGTGGTGTPSITDLLNGTQDPSAFGDLIGALTGMGTTGGTSLDDLLAGLGIPSTGGRTPTVPTVPGNTNNNPMTNRPTTGRDAGTNPRLGGFTTPTAADCANPSSSQLTQIVCQMQQGSRRDAGIARPTVPPTAPAPTAPAPTAPAPTAPAPTTPAPTAPAPAPTTPAPTEPAPTTPTAPVEPTPPPPATEPPPAVPADVDAGVTG
jgi:hypothetical protein